MNINDIVKTIQQDPKLNPGEKLLIRLDRLREAMLLDAWHLSAGGRLRPLPADSFSDGVQGDEAAIRLSEDGETLVAFHETRTNSENHRPNGIQVMLEELHFPCVVFHNSGTERMTIDGTWIAPGEYTWYQDADMNRADVQKALAEFIRSPEVMQEVEEVRRQMRLQEEARKKEGEA